MSKICQTCGALNVDNAVNCIRCHNAFQMKWGNSMQGGRRQQQTSTQAPLQSWQDGQSQNLENMQTNQQPRESTWGQPQFNGNQYNANNTNISNLNNIKKVFSSSNKTTVCIIVIIVLLLGAGIGYYMLSPAHRVLGTWEISADGDTYTMKIDRDSIVQQSKWSNQIVCSISKITSEKIYLKYNESDSIWYYKVKGKKLYLYYTEEEKEKENAAIWFRK